MRTVLLQIKSYLSISSLKFVKNTQNGIKANLQVDLILLLDEFDYPPVTIDDVYKEVLEQAENFKKYAD